MSGGFRKLVVWQRSKALAVAVYRLTDNPQMARDFSLRDQMRRSVVSVCSNIAEGDARQTDKESVQFFFIAKGSLAEISAQLEIAAVVHSLPPTEVDPLLLECDELAAMLQAIINHRRR